MELSPIPAEPVDDEASELLHKTNGQVTITSQGEIDIQPTSNGQVRKKSDTSLLRLQPSNMAQVEAGGAQEKQRKLSYEAPMVKHPTSFIETLIHLLKGNIGAGMFAMGEAFKNAGLVAGPILTLFLGVVCIYNNHVLINCAHFVRDKNKLGFNPSFHETVELSFKSGPTFFQKWTTAVRISVKTFVILTQLGFCCVYVVLVSSTMDLVLKPYGIVIDVHWYMVMMYVPVLATCLIRSLKLLAPVSLGSNICLSSAVFLTLFIASHDLPSPSTRNLVADYASFPLFFGTTIYAFEGISLVLPLQNEMKDQRRFSTPFGVLNIGLSIVTSLLITVGTIGYLKYGDDVKGSLSLNLDPGIFAESVQSILCIGIVFSYALQFYVAAEIIWKDVLDAYGPFKNPVTGELMVRTILVTFTFLLGGVIPNLGLFIALVGSVCSTALALVYPALCDIALRSGETTGTALESKYPRFRFFMDGLTLFIAVIGFTSGAFCSTRDIIHAFFV